MTEQEINEKINALRVELDKLKLSKKKQLEKKSKIKIGDKVETIRKGNFYQGIPDEWCTSKIYDILKTEEGVVKYALDNHLNWRTEDQIKLFNPDDYTMRHSVWDHELEIGECFQLIVEKPKSTRGDIYEVQQILKRQGEEIEYTYYNDYGKPSTLHEGEFHVVNEKL